MEQATCEKLINIEKEKMSEDALSNLARAVHNDELLTSSANLASTKSRVVKELFQQTDKIIDAAETAKSKGSFFKKRKSSLTSRSSAQVKKDLRNREKDRQKKKLN